MYNEIYVYIYTVIILCIYIVRYSEIEQDIMRHSEILFMGYIWIHSTFVYTIHQIYNQLMVNTLDPLSQYAKQVPVMLGQME